MTKKQKRFCDEYLIDYNATQAASRAGYSKKTAYSLGQRLLKKAEVQEYINQNMENLHSEKIANAREVMEFLTAVMRGDNKEEKQFVDPTGNLGVTYVVNQANQIKCAELLGKRHRLFTDNVSVTADSQVVIVGGDKLED